MEEAMGAGRYSFVAAYASGAYDADRGLGVLHYARLYG